MTEAPQQPSHTLQKASVMPFVVAIMVMTLIGLLVVVGILWLRPDDDNAPLITTVIGFIATMTGVIMTFIKSTQTDLTVNSSLAQWKQDFAALQHAQGAAQGAAEEQARIAKMRADALAGEASSAAAKAISVLANGVTAAKAAPAPLPVEVGKVTGSKPDVDLKAEELNVHTGSVKVIKEEPKP